MKQTPLYDFHLAYNAKIVDFAGYALPVQYELGVMKEHIHTREAAGLFDVSHMGQIMITAKSGAVEDITESLEKLLPTDLKGLALNRQTYSLLTNENGGIRDDLMISRHENGYYGVVNGAVKATDFAYISSSLGSDFNVEFLDRALIALQGPKAESALSHHMADVQNLRFMDNIRTEINGIEVIISRSGYTGEDGFEISLPNDQAAHFAHALCENPDVKPIGLGARDSLRLEAGMCLYGHDITEETTPVEADLKWAIHKNRRESESFVGAKTILSEFKNGASRKRVGLIPEGRAPMREGTKLFADQEGKTPIGTITSGGFGPTVGHPISMGYVDTAHIATGETVYADIRGKFLPATVTKLPFYTPNYKR